MADRIPDDIPNGEEMVESREGLVALCADDFTPSVTPDGGQLGGLVRWLDDIAVHAFTAPFSRWASASAAAVRLLRSQAAAAERDRDLLAETARRLTTERNEVRAELARVMFVAKEFSAYAGCLPWCSSQTDPLDYPCDCGYVVAWNALFSKPVHAQEAARDA